MVQHITVNCSFTKLSSHGWKCLETFQIPRLQKCFRGNVQMSYACIFIFNMNLTQKNEFDLFKSLLNVPMLLCKGFMSHQQLWSY